MRRALLYSAAALGLAGGALAAWFLLGTGWRLRARRRGDSLLFDEHITPGPGNIYTAAENAAMSRKIDVTRFATDQMKRREIVDILTFGRQVGVGEAAPDFKLRTANGGAVRLSELRGRYVVFMFAAMTCPPARLQAPRFEALQAGYSRDDVVFLLIYSRERHAGERGYPDFEYAATNAEKTALAKLLAQQTTLPIAVDTIDEQVLSLYGAVPNSAYVIDREGMIVFRCTWADSRKIEQVLELSLEAERNAKRRVAVIE